MSMNINAKQAEMLKNYYLEGNSKGISAKEIKELEASVGKDKIKTFIQNCQRNATVDNNEYEFAESETTITNKSETKVDEGKSWDNVVREVGGYITLGGAGCAAAGAVALIFGAGWAMTVIGIGAAIAAGGGLTWGVGEVAKDDTQVVTQENTANTVIFNNGAQVNQDATLEVTVTFGEMENLLSQILAKITNIDANVESISADLSKIEQLLGSIDGKLDQLNDTQRKMYEMLQANFKTLSREIRRGNELAAEVLAAVIKYGNDNNAANQTIIDLLGKIHEKMYELDANQQNSFNLILQGIRGLNAQDYSAQLQAIYNQLCDIDGNITDTGKAILDKMDETIDAVDRNGEKIDQANLTLNEILNKIKAGNATFEEIGAYLQAIQNNTGDAAVDLALIRNLLGQILDNEVQQNNVLKNIDGQYAQILEDIYNKIPEMLNSGNTTNINVEVNLLIVYLLEIFSGTEQGQRANEGQAQDEFNWIFNREENPDMPQGGALARYNELIAGGMTEQEAIRQLLQELFGGNQNE